MFQGLIAPVELCLSLHEYRLSFLSYQHRTTTSVGLDKLHHRSKRHQGRRGVNCSCLEASTAVDASVDNKALLDVQVLEQDESAKKFGSGAYQLADRRSKYVSKCDSTCGILVQ